MNGTQRHSLTGKHMFALMVGFFAIILIANMSLVYFATQSWTGLVVQNSFVASQQFNATTAQLEKAKAGVNVRASVDRDILRLQLSATDGGVISATNVTVTIGRPTHEGQDMTLKLAAEGNGEFSIRHKLLAGVWSGQIFADIPGHPGWDRPLRIIVGE